MDSHMDVCFKSGLFALMSVVAGYRHTLHLFISHFLQKQPQRRRGHSCTTPIAGGQNRIEFFRGNLSPPDVHHGADKSTDHAVDETVRGNFIDQSVILNNPYRAVYHTRVVFYFGCVRAEGAEIMPTRHTLRDIFHRRKVQRRQNQPAETTVDGGGLTGDEIPVPPDAGIEAGMERGRNLFHRVNTDIPGKNTI